ncbi:MAG: hypothetical protein IT374_18605 [Polyangiaceae bacterium]|nr:hypothetical protein [Polyangiaceae bacterium]
MLTARAALIVSLGAASACLPAIALADEHTERRATHATGDAKAAYDLDRPHSHVELGVGVLTLPSAHLCITTECTSTDLTLLLELRHVFMFNRRFGLEAGVAWGFRPVTAEANLHAPDGEVIERRHSRNYFMVSGGARYYPITSPGFLLWTGAKAGVVVASDRYASPDRGESILGPRSTVIRSEGVMGGLALGADWPLRTNWLLGVWTTQMLWNFPGQRACAQTRECASVGGTLYSFEAGLAVTYRVHL